MSLSRFFVILGLAASSNVAFAQTPDFLHPQQKGPFQINGLGYGELAVAGPQSGYIDPLNLGSGYTVPTLDQIIGEMKATGANFIKITVNIGQVKNYNDNAYDPTVPFPLEGTVANIQTFGQKLTSQGISCLLQPFSGVENIIAGATVDTSRLI